MPALITHHLFGEESIDRLPQGVITSDEERIAFILGNQGPDPFFLSHSDTACFRLHAAGAGHASVAHVSPVRVPARRRVASAAARRQLGSCLCAGPAVSLRARPQRPSFVYEQQFGIVESDSELENSSSQVHAVIESDLDVLMLQLKRDGATVDDYLPAGEIVTTDRINRVAGVLMSYVAGRVYGIDIPAGEYGAAVANMQRLYRAIEPAGSAKTRAISLVEGLVHDYSLLDGLAHRVTTELPERTGNLGHLTWKNPFTDEVSNESFPEVFDRALVDYECTVARFIETGDMDAVTGHINYSGRVLEADEEFDREE